MQEKSVWKGAAQKVGRGLKYAVVPVGIWRTGVDTVRSLKETTSAAVESFRGMLRFEDRRDSWRSAVLHWGATEVQLRKQVRVRQLAALISAAFMALGLFGIIEWGSVLPGLCCFGLASIYYLQSALRLHQIRNRDLCSLTEYLRRVTNSPSELLPLGLPRGWRIL